jgi:Holliday junction resolvase
MTRDSFLNRDKTRGTFSHRRAPKQERQLAERIGGRITVASGAKQFEKGDVRKTRVVRIEAKTTKNKSFSVTTEIIQKIEDAALAAGEMPVIVIELNNMDPRKRVSVAVVPLYVLDMLSNNNDDE